MQQRGNVDQLSRICVLEEQMERLLGNGQPGLIAELEEDMRTVRENVSGIGKQLSEAKWKAVLFFGILITAIVAAGSGTVSLKSLLEFLK